MVSQFIARANLPLSAMSAYDTLEGEMQKMFWQDLPETTRKRKAQVVRRFLERWGRLKGGTRDQLTEFALDMSQEPDLDWRVWRNVIEAAQTLVGQREQKE
jgi:hypothetical protein